MTHLSALLSPTTTTTTSYPFFDTLLKPTLQITMSRQGYTRLPDIDSVAAATSSENRSTSSIHPVLHNIASTPRSATASRAHVLESLVPLSKAPWSSVPTIIYTDPANTKADAKANASNSPSSSASGNTKH
ncbi:hypothetical protein BGZ82_009270 [Podila clonocystis]|nr:hypothetical protein BGZ82_009270 [Podila clonocystis]